MAPKQKRPSPLDDPPSASSSSDSDEEQDQHIISRQQQQRGDDEEEQASSEEQEEDDEEEEEEQVQPSPAVQPASKNPPSNSHPKPSSSESATESDSGSDSEPDPPVTNSKVKPLASKPMDQTPKPKPKPNSSAAPPKSASKRPAESNGHVSEPKRPKKKATETVGASSDEETEEDRKKSGDDSKKLFQRVFSEDDEIAILKGLVEFTSKTGSDPLKHAEAFHDFMKKSLRVDASSNQLKQKIRRLKKKFETNSGKGGKNGEGPSFSKPHDQKSFELSKKVWGNAAEGATNNGVAEKEKEKENPKSNGKARKSPKKEIASKREPKPEPKAEQKHEMEKPLVDSEEPGKADEKGDAPLALRAMIRFDKVVGMSTLGEDAVKERVEGIEASKRAGMEEKWRELQDAELELYVKRAELIAEQARLMLQAHRSSKN